MSAHRRRQKTDLPEFRAALDAAHVGEGPQPSCHNHPDEFVDYSHADMPTKEDAELLCERCPLMTGVGKPGQAGYIPAEICLKNARHRKPQWGVLGGKVWIQGRQAHLMAEDDARLVDQEK